MSAGERTLAPLGRRLATVTAHRRLGPYDLLACADPAAPAPDPGQFYMLAAAERWGGGEDERPFLPRAFSVARSHADGTREFLLEAVGPGTRRLGELRAGEALWLLGPLGRGFAPPRDGRRPLLVGGGVGIAPLAIWSDALAGAGEEPAAWRTAGPSAAPPDTAARGVAETSGTPVVLLGFRDRAHADGAALIPGARVATDDGSAGHAGLVTELLAEALAADAHAEVYACGPPPMLEAVRRLCAADGVPAQLALEAGMACGFGACFGCVVATRAGYVRLCVDGPVLDAERLDLDAAQADPSAEAADDPRGGGAAAHAGPGHAGAAEVGRP